MSVEPHGQGVAAVTHHVTDVLIVGGGPVGAALAGDLGQRGISNMLVEMTDGVFRDPRLHAVNIRTMELARRWGISDELRNCGWPQDHSQDVVFAASLTGHELARIPWPSIADMRPPASSPTFAQRCPQSWFNPILLGFAKRQPATSVHMRWRCDSFEQHPEHVVAFITDLNDDARHTVTARYLVAADGSRSNIRRALGIGREGPSAHGQSAEAIVHIRNLAGLLGKPVAGRYTMVTPQGMSSSLLPYNGQDLYRMTMMVEPDGVRDEDMLNAVRQLIGRDVTVELRSPVLPWINRETCANAFVAGRVLLAGDAAHTMPTTGGFGMNTGILDAWDLGWKLQALLEGWGGPGLLMSYEYERKLAAQRTARLAGAIYKDWLAMKPVLASAGDLLDSHAPAGIAYRARLAELLTKTFTREFNSLGGALGYRYEGSPICIADETPEPPDSLESYQPTSRPGHLAPHAWLADGRSTLDLFGAGFVLLTVDAQDGVAAAFDAAARSSGLPFAIHRLAPSAASAYERRHVLVRPDGHVCWRSDAPRADAQAVIDVIRGAELVGT